MVKKTKAETDWGCSGRDLEIASRCAANITSFWAKQGHEVRVNVDHRGRITSDLLYGNPRKR